MSTKIRPGQRLAGTFPLCLSIAGLAALSAELILIVAHVDDRYRIDHVAGAWIALGRSAEDGLLYPPLFDSGYYGGTRYAPLGIGLYAMVVRLPGDPVPAGKLVSAVLMIMLLAVLHASLRRSGASRSLSLAGLGAVIASFPAAHAATSTYGDLLPVTLQVCAVALVASGTDRRRCGAAGVLIALAFAAKVSAVWGGATILIWLLLHARRSLPVYLGACVVTAGATFASSAVLSSGRMQTNLLSFTSSGLELYALRGAMGKFAGLLVHDARATAVLVPLAVVVVVKAVWDRRIDIWHVALVTAAAVTALVLADVGAGYNHLLDVAVLVPAVAVTGVLRWREHRSLTAAVAVVLPVAIAASLYQVRADLTRGMSSLVLGTTATELQPQLLDGRLGARIFTEDPLVAIDRDERPVALDSFMLLRVARDHPEWERALVRRFAAKEFDTVVLITDPDPSSHWYREIHLGAPLATAIARNYSVAEAVRGPEFTYQILEPVG